MMTNAPTRVGERYLSFVVSSTGRGWSGPYGQSWSGPTWTCVVCGYIIREFPSGLDRRRAAEHHACGHAPCAYCGEMLLRRKDGTTRQHAANRCSMKTPGHRIEREFVKNIGAREFV